MITILACAAAITFLVLWLKAEFDLSGYEFENRMHNNNRRLEIAQAEDRGYRLGLAADRAYAEAEADFVRPMGALIDTEKVTRIDAYRPANGDAA